LDVVCRVGRLPCRGFLRQQKVDEGDNMLFLKSTTVTKAPGIYEVDIAAKPPGKTFGIFIATDPDNPPTEVLAKLAAMGFQNTYRQNYTHKDKGKVLDLHFQKAGTDLFQGWKTEENEANMAAIKELFAGIGIEVAPRVMSLAEAYA
jgi:hypothetical protein